MTFSTPNLYKPFPNFLTLSPTSYSVFSFSKNLDKNNLFLPFPSTIASSLLGASNICFHFICNISPIYQTQHSYLFAKPFLTIYDTHP